MNKGMVNLDNREKDREKKDHKKKEKKEDEAKIKIGIDVEVKGPKVKKRPPKRGGCTSSAASGLIIGPRIKVKPRIEIEPGDRKNEYEVIVTRPIKEGKVIGSDDVEEREVSRRGRRALDGSQVVGRRASRDLRAGEIMSQGMTK